MSASSPAPPTAMGTPSSLSGSHVQLAPGVVAKVRNPILVVVFTIITLGIYQIFWWYYANRELAGYGRARGTGELGDDPMKSTLALFPGALVVVPAIWTMVTTFKRIQAAQRLTGQTPINGWLGFVLVLVFSPALVGYMQSGLNSAWNAAAPAAQPGPISG
jgi:hypothetical protein